MQVLGALTRRNDCWFGAYRQKLEHATMEVGEWTEGSQDAGEAGGQLPINAARASPRWTVGAEGVAGNGSMPGGESIMAGEVYARLMTGIHVKSEGSNAAT